MAPVTHTDPIHIENTGEVCFENMHNSLQIRGYVRPAGCYSSHCTIPLEQSLTVQLDLETHRIQFNMRFVLSVDRTKCWTGDCGGAEQVRFDLGDIPEGKYSVWLGTKRLGSIQVPTDSSNDRICFDSQTGPTPTTSPSIHHSPVLSRTIPVTPPDGLFDSPLPTPTPICAWVPPTVTPADSRPPGAPLTPYPTPTPPPTPTWSPLALGTPPPPEWTPIPPQEPQAVIDTIIGYLNHHPNDWVGLEEMLNNLGEGKRTWMGQPWPPSSDWKAVKWANEVDLDQDGTDEIVLAYHAPYRTPASQIAYDFVRWSVLARRDGHFVLACRGTSSLYPPDPLDPISLDAVRDVNQDGKLELVITTGDCGAHTCSSTVHIGQWDGIVWRALGEARTSDLDLVQWIDEDGDGIDELLLHGGTVGSAGAGLHRPSTFVYGYRDGQYQLIERRRDPSTHIYFTMLDANNALAHGKYDRALELASQNLALPPPVGPLGERYSGSDFENVTETSYGRIMAYSAIEAMLIHGLRSEPDEMLSLLARIERDYEREENPYVQAARCLWETYQASGDIGLACRVMQWTVQRSGSIEAMFWQSPGYATETLPLDRLCPLGN